MQDIIENNSGRKYYAAPDIVANKFNWGAAIFTWIWGIFNKTYITLYALLAVFLFFIPFIGHGLVFIMCIWFGINGNKWAWQNKRFKSVESFHDYQKKWAIASAIVIGIFSFIIMALSIYTAFIAINIMFPTQEEKITEKALNVIGGFQCELTSVGLAKCFEKRVDVLYRKNNVIFFKDGTVWTFIGDGRCKISENCVLSIKVKNGNIVNIPLLANKYNYVHTDDICKLKYPPYLWKKEIAKRKWCQ